MKNIDNAIKKEVHTTVEIFLLVSRMNGRNAIASLLSLGQLFKVLCEGSGQGNVFSYDG